VAKDPVAVTKVTTYAVLLRDRDSEDYAIGATYRGLTVQEVGVVFFVDRIEGERTFSGRRIAETAPPP